MNTDNGQTTSLWMATADVAPQAALDGDVTTDICIVGAGIAVSRPRTCWPGMDARSS